MRGAGRSKEEATPTRAHASPSSFAQGSHLAEGFFATSCCLEPAWYCSSMEGEVSSASVAACRQCPWNQERKKLFTAAPRAWHVNVDPATRHGTGPALLLLGPFPSPLLIFRATAAFLSAAASALLFFTAS